jgi:putative transposase
MKIRQQLPGISTDKLHHLLTDFLAEHQIKLGRDKLYALLREHHLLRTKRRKRAKRLILEQVCKPGERLHGRPS